MFDCDKDTKIKGERREEKGEIPFILPPFMRVFSEYDDGFSSGEGRTNRASLLVKCILCVLGGFKVFRVSKVSKVLKVLKDFLQP